MKLKWTKHCVLAIGSNDIDDVNSNNISFTIKNTKLYVPVVIYRKKTIKNDQNFLSKDLKAQLIGLNIKQKVGIKIQQMSIDIFSHVVDIISYIVRVNRFFQTQQIM